jgi:hypothetical protein
VVLTACLVLRRPVREFLAGEELEGAGGGAADGLRDAPGADARTTP